MDGRGKFPLSPVLRFFRVGQFTSWLVGYVDNLLGVCYGFLRGFEGINYFLGGND